MGQSHENLSSLGLTEVVVDGDVEFLYQILKELHNGVLFYIKILFL
jgi:hypothetical protein